MKEKIKNNNKYLKIILPILALILFLTFVIILILPKGISSSNYFKALANSNYTRQEQITTIIEKETVVFEKKEVIVIDGKNIYHKITEKQIALGTELYEETTTEFYYDSEYMYYFENNEWKVMEYDIKKGIKSYSLKKQYFITLTFDKKVEKQGVLEGFVKDENIDDAFNSETEFHTAALKLIVDKNFKVQQCNIKAKTASNRNVTVNNIFTYNEEVVVLPN